MTSTFLSIAAFSGFLAVALGAFGAHALKDRLDAYASGIYQTAVLYQFIHTLALLACAILLLHSQSASLITAAYAFIIGIVLFSGSLYTLSLTGIKKLGAVTPIGGLAFLIGWGALFYAAISVFSL